MAITIPVFCSASKEKIARGDKFGIATDPATLPPVVNGMSTEPNGYFTARELDLLKKRGIEVIEMFK